MRTCYSFPFQDISRSPVALLHVAHVEVGGLHLREGDGGLHIVLCSDVLDNDAWELIPESHDFGFEALASPGVQANRPNLIAG